MSMRRKKTYKKSDEFIRSNRVFEGDASIAEIESILWRTREYAILGNLEKTQGCISCIWITLQQLSKSVIDKLALIERGGGDIQILSKQIASQMLTIRKGGKYELNPYLTKEG